MMKDKVWALKYRPKNVDDCILPDKIKNQFLEFAKDQECPNLILAGGPGCGKTTVAMALLEHFGCDYIIINSSMHGNIDTLRNEITQYASSMSFSGKKKFVILDEADYLNANSTQPALRNFMEEFSANCGFILTCNYLSRIIEPLHSRCSIIQFKVDKKDLPGLSVQFMKRLEYILGEEGVKFDKKVLATLIFEHAPDWRRILNEVQRNSASGVLDESTVSMSKEVHIDKLVGYIKNKKFDEMRKWVAENSDIPSSELFRAFYNKCYDIIEHKHLPSLIIMINDYQYKAAFVTDQEINTCAFITNVMMECDFK